MSYLAVERSRLSNRAKVSVTLLIVCRYSIHKHVTLMSTNYYHKRRPRKLIDIAPSIFAYSSIVELA